MPNNLLAILPEVILTITGVLIMLLEPVLAPGKSRKPLGWLAIFGTLLSMLGTFSQRQHIQQAVAAMQAFGFANPPAAFTAFYRTIQIDNFSIFFHLLISSIVLITLLASLDYFEGPVTHAGEGEDDFRQDGEEVVGHLLGLLR